MLLTVLWADALNVMFCYTSAVHSCTFDITQYTSTGLIVTIIGH